MAVDLVGGYLYKIIATIGLAAEVPTLELGQIAWDTDAKTFRVGDETSSPPRIPSTKSTGSFNFESVDYFRFQAIQLVNGGKIDGVDPSTMNQSNGFVARKADGQFHNRTLTSGNDSISIVYADAVDGNPDLRISDSLIALLTPPRFWVSDEEPADVRVGDFWHDTDGPDGIEGNSDDGIVYIRNTNGITEYWTQVSNEYQNASEEQVGLTRYATTAEALARVLNTVALTPRSITALIGAGNDYRTVLNATLTAPPGAPTALDAYLIPIGATGVWSPHVGKIATWDGAAWIYDTLRVGAVVVDSNKALSSAPRYLKQTAALTWSNFTATETEYGLAKKASEAIVLATTDDELFVTSKNLRMAVSEFAKFAPIYPESLNSGQLYNLTITPGQVVVATGNNHIWRGQTLIRSSDYLAAARTFTTLPNQQYHLRWYAPGHARAIALGKPNGGYALESIGDLVYNPSSLSQEHSNFDTTYDSMLIAFISTNGSNILSSLPVKNVHSLIQTLYSAVTTPGSSTGLSVLSSSRSLRYTSSFVYNWSRYPTQIAQSNCSAGYSNLTTATVVEQTAMGGYANNTVFTFVGRYGITIQVTTDFVDIIPINFSVDTVFGIISVTIEA